VADRVRGDRIVLAKNKDYHVKGLPHLDKVTFRFIPNPNSALAALKSGDIDVSAFVLGPEKRTVNISPRRRASPRGGL
jgi:peptide/nickel transport system substrate-binding protein